MKDLASNAGNGRCVYIRVDSGKERKTKTHMSSLNKGCLFIVEPLLPKGRFLTFVYTFSSNFRVQLMDRYGVFLPLDKALSLRATSPFWSISCPE